MKTLILKTLLFLFSFIVFVPKSDGKVYAYFVEKVNDNCFRFFLVMTTELNGVEVYVTSGFANIGSGCGGSGMPVNPDCPPYQCDQGVELDEFFYTDANADQCLGPLICENYEEYEIARNAAYPPENKPTGGKSINLNEKSIRIFPNPTEEGSNKLFIATTLSDIEVIKDASIEIYDMTGKKIFRQIFNSDKPVQEIELPKNSPGGTYIFLISKNKNMLYNGSFIMP